ncbi:helix-turn-helix domain-containing protein [Mycobacteroides abscessus]|uniref:helix-turn-helix domain-containing protein n=1 Tax=Mycobacteroides abscessus TaxID=36809 RepID=UPI000E6899CB|nr:helix-turn-helix domain-containing protein [Mycobacteroides abscessus]RIS37566.1 helix-turn-helix domain-containing protein [Mycobacteroides abscessus]RIS70053.1 helix-turn-helix domain-containing protein [Mycobacteroides abscessus]
MKFSKFCWLESIRCDSTVPATRQRVIAQIGATADENGNGAWMTNERVMKALNVSLRTVKRARREAVEKGYWVITKPGRACGQGAGFTTHYRLTMPAVNGVSTAPISEETPGVNGATGDTLKEDLTVPPESVNSDTSDPLWCHGSDPSSVLPSELSSGESRAREEPLDVTAVPEVSDALSRREFQVETIIDGELVEPYDDDPEPQYGCDEHPLGHGKRCSDCGIARHHYNRWRERNAARVADQVFGLFNSNILDSPPAPARPRCPWCRDTGLVLMSDGKLGSPPMWCPHELYGRRPATDEEIAEYERRTA